MCRSEGGSSEKLRRGRETARAARKARRRRQTVTAGLSPRRSQPAKPIHCSGGRYGWTNEEGVQDRRDKAERPGAWETAGRSGEDSVAQLPGMPFLPAVGRRRGGGGRGDRLHDQGAAGEDQWMNCRVGQCGPELDSRSTNGNAGPPKGRNGKG